MSYLKISPNLFLEKQELNRLKRFQDTDSTRAFLLANSLKFGLINKQFFNSSLQNEFLNGKIIQGTTLTISHEAISAIDSNGNIITRDATLNIATTADSNWYWVKIKYRLTPNEKGIVAIDANGNLTGDANCKFTEVLRGQPNFPSRIKLVDSALNTLEYDVLEVIDDQNAILDNDTFLAEVNLKYKVIGTFTPSSVPEDADKDIFQYDDCELTLVAETVLNTPPTFVDGEEFFLARIKNNGISLIIQDKRTEIWRPKTDLFNNNIRNTAISWFGVEKVKYNDVNTPRDRNLVYLSWNFRSTNYSVNSNLNILTIIGGQGGKYKTVNDFTDGDFDGCRVYTSDGKYSIIKSSIKTGGQINCTLDVLDIDKYSNDGGSTFTGSQVVITPDAEEIEVICKAQEDHSESSTHIDEVQLSDKRFVFPISIDLAQIELIVYDNPTAIFEISYRFKHDDIYSAEFTMPADTASGYYTEKAFDGTGNFLPIVLSNNYAQNLAGGYITIYTAGLITLTINSQAYSIKIAQLDLGDLLGVETVVLDNASPQVLLTVGTSRQYQHFSGPPIVLSADMYIILDDLNSDGLALTNGNKFFLHFQQEIDLSTFALRIVKDFVNVSSYTLLKEFTETDTNFIAESEEGIFIRATVNDNIDWILNSTNEVYLNDPWHNVGEAGEPAFATDISNANPAANVFKVSFRKDREGKVHIRGGFRYAGGNFPSNLPIFTLPADYWPAKHQHYILFPSVDGADRYVSTAAVRYNDGVVLITNGGNPALATGGFTDFFPLTYLIFDRNE